MHWIAPLILAGAVTLTGCGGKEERRAKHMERGKAYLEQADYDKARIEFRNVLQIDPKDAQGYYLSGLVAERQANWGQAFANYSKAVEVAPEHLEAKTKLGRIHLLTGDTAKAAELAQAVLAARAADSSARTLHAAVLAQQGDVAGATREAKAVLGANPAELDAASLLAGLFVKQGDTGQAEQVLRNAIKANPRHVPMRLDLANLLVRANRLPEIEPLLQEVAALEPKKYEHQVRLAAYYADMKRVDAAEKVLRDAIAANPDDEQRYLALAQLLAEKRSPQAAEQELQSVLKDRPKAFKVRLGLAVLYEATNRPDQAERIYREVIDLNKTGPDRLKARNQLARLLVAKGDISEAGKLLTEILKDNPRDSEALVTRGRMALQREEAQSAIADFRSVLRDQPDSIEYLSLLARAHMAAGERQLARESLGRAVELNPRNPQARLLWADFLALSNDFDSALKEVNEALKTAPLDPGLLQLKAAILSAKKDVKGAEEAIAKLKGAGPNQALGYYRMGAFYLTEKRYDEAIAEFEQALKKAPDAPEPLLGIVQAFNAQGKAERALARVQEVLRANPKHPHAHLFLAEVFQAQGKQTEAEGAYRKAIEINPTWHVPYVGLANHLQKRKEFKAAVQVLQDGLKANAEHPLLAFSLGYAYEASGDFDRAAAAYEALLKTHPGMDMAANNLASLLTDRRGDKASLERALELSRRFENSPNPSFLDTLGWAYVKSGQTARGQALLQKVVEQAPEVAVFRYHFGMALYKNGDVAGARSHLQKATAARDEYPGYEEAKIILAKL
jgi:tetratricopeptide (TPR) repeat protein